MNLKLKIKNGHKRILVELARTLLGLTFVFSGVSKAIDPMGTSIKIGEYLSSFSIPGAGSIALSMSMLLSGFEFLLGAFIIMGSYRRITAIISFAFMCFMTPLTLYIAIFNPVADCGCFGDAFHVSNWQTFLKNLVLLFAVGILLRWPRAQRPLFTKMGRWIPSTLALIGIVVFSIGNYRHLPIVDFRPYKVGASLKKLTQVPEGAEQDEFEYSFIYEKDGKRESFQLDKLPDDSWTYVDRVEKPLKKGYQAPVNDFIVLDKDQDITEELINEKGIKLLLIAPNWSKARVDKMDQIDALYEYAEKNGIAFYGLSAASPEEIDSWRYETGADYPCYFIDASVAQTIIRGNPGLLILKDDVIRAKLNDTDLPKIDEIESFMKTYTTGEIHSESNSGRCYFLLTWALICALALARIALIGSFPSLKLNPKDKDQGTKE